MKMHMAFVSLVALALIVYYMWATRLPTTNPNMIAPHLQPLAGKNYFDVLPANIYAQVNK